MPKRHKIERSANYGYYADVLWCCVPLSAMSCYYYGLRPALLALVAAVAAYLCDGILSPLHAKGYQSHEPSSECFAVLLTMLLPASVPFYVVIAGTVVRDTIPSTRRRWRWQWWGCPGRIRSFSTPPPAPRCHCGMPPRRHCRRA